MNEKVQEFIFAKLIPFLFGALVAWLLFGWRIYEPSVLGYEHLNKLINSKRRYPLISSPVLDQVAYCRAQYLYNNDLFTHVGWKRCFDEWRVEGWIGEILAKNFDSDEATVVGWMNSLSHRNAMLGNYKFIGSSKVGNITVVTFSKP